MNITQGNMPIVSIPVITYNSEKTVLETLESIKAQTYPNIELIVSDDCSTDNTVELCRDWVEQNKERFARVEILTVVKNTGVSGNINRAAEICQGEWVKPIAGDDVLTPNCIQDCMDYVMAHSDSVYLFGRQKAFGIEEKKCADIDKWFDYSFFSMSNEQQLHRLLFKANCVPATTLFYNREKSFEIGVKNDERIPLLEDWPKWINLLRAGVKLHFVNKVLVKYRIGGISTGVSHRSTSFYRANRQVCFYYQYPEWCKENLDKAVERVVNDEVAIYEEMIRAERQLDVIQKSKAYRLGRLLLKPFKWIKRK